MNYPDSDAAAPSPLSILIVEDDLSFALELEMTVLDAGHRLAATVSSADEALTAVRTENVDLILMDISLNGRMTGLDVGRHVAHTGIPILYITSHATEEHYQASRMPHVIGYLTKPISRYSLKTMIELARGKLKPLPEPSATEPPAAPAEERDYFFIRGREGYEKILRSAIHLVEGAADYVRIYTQEARPYLVRATMTDIETELGADIFFRVHRSYIVNVTAVESINFSGHTLRILQREIPLSRRKRGAFEAVLRRLG